MKRIISLVLILVMLFSLVACNGGQTGSNAGGNQGGNNIADSENNSGNTGNNGGNSNNSGGNSNNNGGNSGNNNSGNTGNNGGNSDDNVGNSGNDGGQEELPSPDYPEEDIALFNAFFNPENHISLKLDISNEELKKMQKDYENYRSFGSKSPIYRMADLYITITTPDGSSQKHVIEQVGVRMKGNTSRTDFYSDDNGMYNLIHFKISFGETFDEEAYYGSDALVWDNKDERKARKNRTFATLQKIDIRWNRNDDPTYIREGYAYDLYREFGVLAPHTNLASVDIGNDHAGVFVVYEPIDKIFLEKNLPTSALGGDLYKLGWTNEGATFTSFKSYGIEDEDEGKFYIYDLKTNKKTSTHESLKNLITKINQGITKDGIAEIIDINNFMYFCAVSYFIGNPDDLRNNFNNCYLYFRADTGKAMFIPYDLDRGLGVNKDWNPSGHCMTLDSPFQRTGAGSGTHTSPIFLKTVCRDGMYKEEYVAALLDVDNSEMLTNKAFKDRFDLAKSLYSKETSPSKGYHNAGGYSFTFDINKTANPGDSSNMSFADYMSQKRATLYAEIGDNGNTSGGGNGNESGGGSESGGNNNGGDTGKDENEYLPDNEENNGGTNENETPVAPQPITKCTAYIRGDFTNNWNVEDRYKMTDSGNGIFTYTLKRNSNFRFKLYNRETDKWYGSEIIADDCTVSYSSDDTTNIYLDAGTYLITFDTQNVKIYIEKVG